MSLVTFDAVERVISDLTQNTRLVHTVASAIYNAAVKSVVTHDGIVCKLTFSNVLTCLTYSTAFWFLDSSNMHLVTVDKSVHLRDLPTNAYGEIMARLKSPGSHALRCYAMYKFGRTFPSQCAYDIEHNVHLSSLAQGNINVMRYKSLIYKVIFNAHSPETMTMLTDGDLGIADIVNLHHRTLAPVFWQENALLPGTRITVVTNEIDETTQSILQCRRCHKRHVEYVEVQTRSADEPMTVKAYCRNCGLRWSQ